jgi:high-affinity nickel-transport protein
VAHVTKEGPKPAVRLPLGALRALGVGVVHGLAGSAAVALLVLASISDARFALLYLAVFGVGTILGMMTLTSALALPVAYAAERFARVHRGLARAAGVLSVAFGLFLAYRIGFVEGLFRAAP